MNKMNRREFLKITGLGGVSLVGLKKKEEPANERTYFVKLGFSEPKYQRKIHKAIENYALYKIYTDTTGFTLCTSKKTDMFKFLEELVDLEADLEMQKKNIHIDSVFSEKGSVEYHRRLKKIREEN